MDLNEVSVFLKVVQTGSFSQAAKQLGMPNSTVSHKVSSLEKRLGVTLIQRTTRKLNITPAGSAYFKRCVQGLDEIHAAEQEIANLKGEPQGLLRITAPVELGNSVLPRLVSAFVAKYPQASVEMILTDRRVDLLGESVDLAIRAGDLRDSTLIAKKIGTVYFATFASPRYLKSAGTPSHPRDLVSHNCIDFAPIGKGDWKLIGPKGSFSASHVSRIVANDMNVVHDLALSGEGIVLLPTHYCLPEVKSGKLVRVLPDWRSATSPVHFVYPAQRFVTPKLSAFMEMGLGELRATFEEFRI